MTSLTRRAPGLSARALTSPAADGRAKLQIDAFYRRSFSPLVRQAAWRHGLSEEDARDIVQDAFLLALPRFRSVRNPKAWLSQVVDNLAANWQRKLERRAELLVRWLRDDMPAEQTESETEA